uniref:SHC SH2 domain-binding protein 1-like protein n=1 Tax=Phallusia mammillata TaxID=59560 RepID=A0A6F9DSS0_9ASCI|nr:SHC SH2 domain-binding protein 1-like protein [Phallusia mammillata]
MSEIVDNIKEENAPNPELLEHEMTNMMLNEVPCSSKQISDLSVILQMPKMVVLPPLSCQERYDIYCKQVKVANCRPAQVMNRIHSYIEENLMNKKWFALWKGPYDGTTCHTVDILVEVDDVCIDQAHVNLVEPLICSEPTVPREVVETQLEELDYTLDIIELYPVYPPDEIFDDGTKAEFEYSCLENLEELSYIAQVIDNVRFFYEHIRRDWDDEDEGEHAFDAYLRARLQLYYDVVSGFVPAPLITRYNRTMAKYFVRRRELLDYQARIQSEGEPTNTEAVECWRKYYEVLMLSGLLQIWETLQLRAEGPCFPRVLRRTKGAREDKSTVTHVVAETLSLSMLRSFPDDTVIQQHKTPQLALQQAFEDDLILIFPGNYSGEGFHELTESVTIKGEGNKEEIIIEAIPYDDLFVNVCGSEVVLENLTFVQTDNTEGILRVESGHANITSCNFKCDGNGITVREGARLTMKNCTITGAKGAGVEFMAGSVALLENNNISSVCDAQDQFVDGKRTGKGGLHLHVYEPPEVHLHGNHIQTIGGCGVTVGRKKTSQFLLQSFQKSTTEGDGGDASSVQSLSGKIGDSLKHFVDVDSSNNIIEEMD